MVDSSNPLVDEIRRRQIRLTRLRRQHQLTENEISEVSAEVRILQEWSSDMPDFVSLPKGKSREGLPTPSDAVDEIVAENPGIERTEVMDRLEDAVNSDSSNVRTVISSAISRRVRSGQIIQTAADGRLWSKDDPSVQASESPISEPDDDLPF